MQPSDAQILASVVAGRGSMSYTGSVTPVMLRMRSPLFAIIKAMSRETGISFNQLCNSIIDVGLGAMSDQMPPEDWARVSTFQVADLVGSEPASEGEKV
jgi:hypothetical protein